MRPGEQDLRGEDRADAGLVEQLRRELAHELLDLAGKLALLEREVLHAASNSAKGEQDAAELGVASTGRAHRGETVEQPRPAQAAELRTERLWRGHKQRVELVEPGLLRDRCAFTGGHQRPQRLAFARAPRHRPALLCEHAARGPDRVERVGLAARAALSARPTDLEHLLVVIEQEPTQTGAVRRGALDRERAPARSVLGRKPKRLRIAVTVRGNAGLEHDHTARYRDDRDRVRIAVRVDADNEIQLICEHHRSTSSPGWGTTPVPVWG